MTDIKAEKTKFRLSSVKKYFQLMLLFSEEHYQVLRWTTTREREREGGIKRKWERVRPERDRKRVR